MENKLLKRCKVCGTEYEACVSCEKKHRWRVHTDSPEHYYIFVTLMQYQTDHDAKSAYKALRKRGIDLRVTDGYIPSVQKLLAEINSLAHEGNRGKRQEIETKSSVTEESHDTEPVQVEEK